MSRTKGCLMILIPLLVVLWSGCSKKKDSSVPTNNNNNTTNNTDPYYFRFTLNGTTDTISGDSSKSYTTNTNAVLGILSAGKYTLTPSMSLMFRLPTNADTVTENDVLGLAGRTLYFTDSNMKPEIEYEESTSSNTWYSQMTADTSYNVKVASIVFLTTSNYQGYPVRLYVITGTCRAIVHQTVDNDRLLTGSFKMLISRVIY